MKLAVAYTEYQLLQIQALIVEYNLSDVNLITFNKNRIPKWLIETNLFNEIYFLPAINNPRWKRLTKPFVDRYYSLVEQFINGRKIDILIGAQDENTVFAIIKWLANPRNYWSIEDGMANYYHRDTVFKIGISFKNLLFNGVYRYPLDIAYGHGKVRAEKSFRIDPELCVDKGEHIANGKFLKKFIALKQENYKAINNGIRNQYRGKKKLIISRFNKADLNGDESILFKFHPQDEITNTDHIEYDYVTETIPVEVLLSVLDHIDTVQFDSMSSSILNIINLNEDINIQIRFGSKGRPWDDYFSKMTAKYSDRVEFVR